MTKIEACPCLCLHKHITACGDTSLGTENNTLVQTQALAQNIKGVEEKI